MRNNFWIAIAVVAGLSAAVLHASGLTLSPLSFLLIYLAPLPLFLAGLGYGWLTAAAAAVVGSAATIPVLGARAGLFFLFSAGAAPVVLSRLALISRPIAHNSGEGEVEGSGVEWYPEGRLVLWTAALAGTFLTLVIVVAGPGLEAFRTQLKEFALEFTTSITGGMSPDERKALAGLPDLLVILAPLVGASAWLVFMLANMLMASRLLKRWGKSLRPWAAFSKLTFPPQSAIALAALCAASMLPGFIGVAAAVFAAPLATAFAILGLAVIHFLLRDHSARWPLLAGTYAALMLFSWLVMLPLVAVGLAETGWKLRARTAKGKI